MSSSDEQEPEARQPKVNLFNMLDEEDEDEEETDDAPAVTPIVSNAPVKKQSKPTKTADTSLDQLLADLQLDTKPSDKKKKKSKKNTGKGQGESAVVDMQVHETIVDSVAATSSPIDVANSSRNELDDLLAELASPEDQNNAADKSKKKKPKKKKEKKEAPPPAVATSKPSAAIALLRQRLEAEKKAEEEFKRAEDERIRLIEERQKLEEEEAARKEEERQRRIEEKKRKQDELRRQGKLLSKGQKAKADKAAAFLEQMRAQGLVPTERTSSTAKPKPKRKPGKQKGKLLSDLQQNKGNPDELPTNEAVDEPVISEESVAHEVEQSAQLEPEIEIEAESIPAVLSESDYVSEASSGSVVDAWDMDSEEERTLLQAKQDRRDQRQQARLKRHRQQLMRQQEKERLERIQAEKTCEQTSKQDDSVKKVPVKKATPDSESSDSESSDEDRISKEEQIKEQSKQDSRNRRAKRKEAALAERSSANLRSPICCILGHVDTGKTKILDKIRRTKVQDAEAGGITQQIGASYFPMASIIEKTSELNILQKKKLEYRLPGLLIIDTPGHESFTNLRSRGSSLCDIAVLVVDIMHGLEQQTLESLRLLRQKKTPFIVALNKIDRIFDWKPIPWAPFSTTLASQAEHSQKEFEDRVTSTVVAFAEQGLNCCLYNRNVDFRKNISLVPTSAITGEGLPDLLMLLVQLSQHMMNERLQYISELQCTVLEVKVVDGIGTTIDVILSNGYLNVNDTIVVCGLYGPIVTTIRALLTPYPMTELRVKGEYQRLSQVKAAAGIKIAASGLEDAVAGSQLLVCGAGDDIEDLKDEVMTDLASILSKVDKAGRGVCVQASTLGSLEALLQFLCDMKIPVSGIAIGPVHKKDVVKCACMLERQPEYAVILAFDVKVSADARQHATDRGIRIFTADIIYHLFDQFTAYMKEVETENQAEAEGAVIFPCVLEIIKEYVFRMKDPIVIGVNIKEGIIRKGTPLCCHDRNNVIIGEISGIELNHKEINEARAGQQVCIKIDPKPGHAPATYGRQFDHTNQLQSKITRQSIDILKASFKDYLTKDDWKCVVKLKKMFDII